MRRNLTCSCVGAVIVLLLCMFMVLVVTVIAILPGMPRGITPARAPAVPIPIPTANQNKSWVSILNRHSQDCAGIQNGNPLIIQLPCDGSSREQWMATAEGKLQNRNGMCAGYQANNQLVQVPCSEAPGWIFVSKGNFTQAGANALKPHPHKTEVPINDGPYGLIQSGNDCWDLDGWSHNVGASVLHTKCQQTDNDNMLWAMY